jgi:DNA invertase Pin-like site-specific DNA recombinase
MSKVIAYLRVSTQGQTNGLDAQRAEVEQWASARGVVVSTWFEDRISGTTAIEKRAGLLAALSSLQKGDVFVVQKRDRLARDAFVASLIDRAVKAKKATLSCAQGGDGEDPNAAFMRGILDLASAFEIHVIKARIKAALAVKKSRGECIGTVPYGFRRDGVGLVKDEAEQEVLACARGLRAAGLTQWQVVAELEASGHLARSGKPFGLSQVQRMFQVAA